MKAPTECDRLWDEVVAELRGRCVRDAILERWLGLVRLRFRDGAVVELVSPNRFVLDWIQKKYLTVIRSGIEARWGSAVEVCCVLCADGPAPAPSKVSTMATSTASAAANPERVSPRARRPSAVPGAADTCRHDLDAFVVAPVNRTLCSAVLGLLEHPPPPFNPIFLFGETAVGKTHLIRGLYRGLQERFPPEEIGFSDGESFTQEFVRGLRDGSIDILRAAHRRRRILLFDDFHVLAGKEKTQQEFLHTLDALVQRGGRMVVASRFHPRQLTGLHESLLSRLVSGLVLPLRPPCAESRKEILRRQAARLGGGLSATLLDHLADNLRGSVSELLGALNQVIAYRRANGEEAGAEGIAAVLEAFHVQQRRHWTPQVLIDAVCRYFHFERDELESRRRDRHISMARQVAVHLCREHTALSLGELGKLFGGRGLGTVRAADQKIRRLLAEDSGFGQTLRDILELTARG